MVDSGLAARLLRLPPGKLTGIDPAALQQFGHLLETFTAGEILKQASWMRHRPHIGHWRSHDGFEVDIVAENSRALPPRNRQAHHRPPGGPPLEDGNPSRLAHLTVETGMRQSGRCHPGTRRRPAPPRWKWKWESLSFTA